MQHIEKGGSVMIDYEKLDKLMELPLSEEMLGAYIEGNLSEDELWEINECIESNDDLRSLVEEVTADNIDDLNELLTNKRHHNVLDEIYDDII